MKFISTFNVIMYVHTIMIPITYRYSSESLTKQTSVKMTLVVKRRNIITRQAIWCNPLNLTTEMYLCKILLHTDTLTTHVNYYSPNTLYHTGTNHYYHDICS